MDITTMPGYAAERAAQEVRGEDAEAWEKRLWRAELAVEAFAAATNLRAPVDLLFPLSVDDGLALEILGDLIADLLHLATINGIVPVDVIDQALRHHTAETEGGDLTPSIFAYLVDAGIAS